MSKTAKVTVVPAVDKFWPDNILHLSKLVCPDNGIDRMGTDSRSSTANLGFPLQQP